MLPDILPNIQVVLPNTLQRASFSLKVTRSLDSAFAFYRFFFWLHFPEFVFVFGAHCLSELASGPTSLSFSQVPASYYLLFAAFGGAILLPYWFSYFSFPLDVLLNPFPDAGAGVALSAVVSSGKGKLLLMKCLPSCVVRRRP